MTESTTDRPTDTIRDAFEAMIAFLTILIGGPMPRTWPEIATVAAKAIGSQARTTEEADRAVAALAGFRAFIQRAAEEHSRRAAAGGDFTPERRREARERCERATPGPWEASYAYNNGGMPTGDFKIPGHNGGATVEMLVDDAYFCAYAREDLPAALREIERLTAELAARAPDPGLAARANDRVSGLYRKFIVERVDGSSGAGRKHERCEYLVLDWQHDRFAPAGGRGYADACEDEYPALAADIRALAEKHGGAVVRAPADASLEAAERAWRGEWQRIAADIRSMSEAGKTPADILAILLTHLDRMPPLAVVRAVDASRPAPADEDTRPRLDVEKEAAARPGLTEEQAEDWAEDIWQEVDGEPCDDPAGIVASALRRASRGETGPAPDLGPGIGGAPIRVRPTAGRRASLEAALHDPETAEGAAAILADMPPDPLALDPEDGTLCADCKTPRNTIHGALCSLRWGKDPGRVPDPRATLRAGDPARCPGPNCKMCNGEACNKCGAGCWNNAAPYCAHGVDERHEAADYSTEEPSQ